MFSLLSLALLGAVAQSATLDRVAGVVNDEVIALSELYDLGGDYIKERCPAGRASCVTPLEIEVLDGLFMQVLMRQELIELGMNVSPEQVESAIARIAKDAGLEGRAELEAAIATQGMDWSSYHEQLTNQLWQMTFNDSVIRPRVVISREEVLDAYHRRTRAVDRPPVYELGALSMALSEPGADALIEGVATARDVMTRINTGEISWSEALQRYDSGLFRDKNDGYLGRFKPGEAMPAIEKAASTLNDGQVSEPVVVGDAIFLIRLISKQSSDVLSFDEAEPQLRTHLFESKAEAEVQRWYTNAKRSASIQNMLNNE